MRELRLLVLRAYCQPTSVQFTNICPTQITFSHLSADRQALTEKLVWALLDPLVETPENEYRTEFLARIAYADFRFTREALKVYGPDSDFGSVEIRLGPADSRVSHFEMMGGTHTWRYRNGRTVQFKESSRTDSAYGVGTDRLKNTIARKLEQRATHATH